MSDCIMYSPTYAQLTRRAIPQLYTVHPPIGIDRVNDMYNRALSSIRKATALYKNIPSSHDTIVKDAVNKHAIACFSERNGLPPIETWIAQVSQFFTDEEEECYTVVDKLNLLLPTDFNNIAQQIDIAWYAMSYLKGELKGKLLFPTKNLQKQCNLSTDYTVSKYVVSKKMSLGTTELRVDKNNSQLFYRI